MDSTGLAQVSQSLRADRSEAFRVRDESEALDMFFHYGGQKHRRRVTQIMDLPYRVIQIMFKVKCEHR
jgi:hypothetical protein